MWTPSAWTFHIEPPWKSKRAEEESDVRDGSTSWRIHPWRWSSTSPGKIRGPQSQLSPQTLDTRIQT